MHPPQEKTGLRAETTNQVQRNTNIEEAKIKLLKEANDFQNALYHFKIRKKEIQAKIQCEIEAVKLNMDDKLPKKLSPTKNCLLSSLVAFNTELKAAKSVLAESCKNSIYPIQKLKELEDMVFYKRINIKWASADLKSQFELRKQIANTLSMLKNPEINPPDQFSLPTYKNGTTASKQTASLISELKSMITEFSTLVVNSKFSNIQLENSKQTTTDPPDKPPATPFVFKPTNDVNVSTLSALPQDTPGTINFKLECPPAENMPIEKLPIFEFKSASRTPPTRRRKATRKPDMQWHISPKSDISSNLIEFNGYFDTGTEIVPFRALVGTDVIYKYGVPKTITVHHQCITLMEEYNTKSLEELRLADYMWAARRGRKYSPVFVLPDDQLRKIRFFYATCDRRHFGTTSHKFDPKVEYEDLIKSGVVKKLKVSFVCITIMPEYQNKSLEELRLEDYVSGRRCSNSAYQLSEYQKESFFGPINMDSPWQKIIEVYRGPSEIKGVRLYGNHHIEDCKMGWNINVFMFSPPKLQNAGFAATTDASVRYSPCVGIDDDTGFIVKYHCITVMPQYEKQSLEELRLLDYAKAAAGGRNYAPVFALSQNHIMNIGFFLVTSLTEKLRLHPVRELFVPHVGTESDGIVKYQCISFMPEFKDKSLEEIRLDAYVVGLYDKMEATRLETDFIGTTEAQETPSQNNQTPERDSTTKTQETSTKKYYGFGHNPSPQTPETPSQKDQTPQRDSTTKPQETPTKKYYGFGHNPSPQTPDTPSQKDQTPQRDSTTKTQETPTKKYYGFGHNPSPQTPETPSQKDQTPQRDSTTKTQETPTKKYYGFGHNPSSQTPETPSQKDQTPQRDSTSKAQETPRKNYYGFGHNPSLQAPETPSQKDQRDSTSKAQETPRKNYYGFGHNPSLQAPETPSQKDQTSVRDSTTKTQETPTQKSHDSTPQMPVFPINEKYTKAVKIANEALKLNPESPYHLAYRANAFLMLRNYKQALEDAQKAIDIDSTTITGYILKAKCCIKLGDIACGEQAVKRGSDVLKELRVTKPMGEQNESNYATDHAKMVELGTRLKELRSNQEQARKLMDREKYYDALDLINSCLDNYCPSCYKTKLLKAECLANVGKYQEAQDIAINLSLFERYDADAIYVVGLCLYNQDKHEQALEHFRKVSNLDPDNKKAAKMYKIAKTRHTQRLLQQKKEEGNQAFKNGKLENALELYSEALLIDKDNKDENAKLYNNKATVLAKLNRTREAEQACTVALDLKHDYIKALERRAHCCTELGEHEDALEDYRTLVELYKKQKLEDRKIKDLLGKAEKALATLKRTNYYYKILGVKNNVKAEDIKKAYRKRSLLYHPDKISFQEKCVADRGARRFRRVKEAYEFLSDTVKRRNYDRRQGADDDDDDDDEDDKYDSDD